MGQIIERGNVAELSRPYRVITVVKLNTSSVLQLEECGVYQSAEVLVDGVGIIAIEVVEGWILRQAPEEVCPCEVVSAVLAMGQGARSDLFVQVVCELRSQAALDNYQPSRRWLPVPDTLCWV